MKALLAGALLATVVSSAWAGENRLIFRKSFPGSVPAYVEIAMTKDGAATYRDDPKDEDPLKFTLDAVDTDQFFSLADKLDHFGHKLESGLKVANMGAKTFRWEAPDGEKEVTFNFSEDLDARALLDLFEKISESERAYISLETAVRFDKLGADAAVLRVEALRDQNRLLPDKQFLPLLDRIARNESFMHMARERAADLADSIRNKK